MSLKSNLKSWVYDRAENNEALMLSEFKSFMKDMGYTTGEINTTLDLYENKMKRLYKALKKKYKD